MHMYVLPVLLDPVSALDQFKGGPVRTRTRTIEDQSGLVLSGPVLVLEFSEDFRTGLDWTLKHYVWAQMLISQMLVEHYHSCSYAIMSTNPLIPLALIKHLAVLLNLSANANDQPICRCFWQQCRLSN